MIYLYIKTLKILNILFYVQLITEFLPISSSGHVQLFQLIFKNIPNLNWTNDYIAHFPAFIISLIIFRKDFFNFFFENKGINFFKNTFFAFIFTFIPIIFFIIKKKTNALFFVSKIPFYYGMIITSYLLFISYNFLSKNYKKNNLTFKDSFIIGLAQSIAILFPGISRFAITLTSCFICKLSPRLSILITTLSGCIFQLGGTLLALIYSLISGKNLIIISNFSEILLLLTSIFFAIIWYLVILNSYKKNNLWYLGFYEILIAIIAFLS